MAPELKSFWLSWWNAYEHSPFTLHWPWWITGARGSFSADADGVRTTDMAVCAAIRAPSASHAQCMVILSHDKPPSKIEWRFCEEQPDGWTPFSSRFEQSDWMAWPEPKVEAAW